MKGGLINFIGHGWEIIKGSLSSKSSEFQDDCILELKKHDKDIYLIFRLENF